MNVVVANSSTLPGSESIVEVAAPAGTCGAPKVPSRMAAAEKMKEEAGALVEIQAELEAMEVGDAPNETPPAAQQPTCSQCRHLQPIRRKLLLRSQRTILPTRQKRKRAVSHFLKSRFSLKK